MTFDKYKSKILDWLSILVNHDFKHDYKDSFISVNIWNNILTITLDLRQDNHVELFNKLPQNIKGCLQYGTDKIVNEKTLYFKISELCSFEYPVISSYKLLTTHKHQESEKGGWYIRGSYWYSYDWEIILSDDSTITYSNQTNKMDLTESDVVYKTKIETKVFINFIEAFSSKRLFHSHFQSLQK